MHESSLLKNILKYLEGQEQASSRGIRKIYVSLSLFGGIKKNHFLEHYKEMSAGTKWESLDIEVKEIPYGPELEITGIDFA